MCGLPGSGKTTMARRIEADRAAIRFTPDEWMTRLGVDLYDEAFRARLEARLWELAQQLVLAGHTVVIDYGSWARVERDVFRLWARAHGIPVELQVLEAPFEELVGRVVERADPGTVPLTRRDMETYLPHWDPPTQAERALFDPPAD
jgi:predicted kinase